MSQPVVKFTYKGNEYKLTYTRKTVKKLSNQGLTPEYVRSNPIEGIPRLFAGSFQVNHASTTQNQIDEMFDLMGDKEELLDALINLYLQPLHDLFGEPDESSKIKWEREQD